MESASGPWSDVEDQGFGAEYCHVHAKARRVVEVDRQERREH